VLIVQEVLSRRTLENRPFPLKAYIRLLYRISILGGVAARLGGEEAEAPKAPSGERRRRENRGACAEGEGVGGGVPLPQQLGGLGERCKLPQWGPGRSPGRS
jgi:hypothetical protein